MSEGVHPSDQRFLNTAAASETNLREEERADVYLDLSRKENDPKSRVTDFNIRENDISSVTSCDQGPPPKKFHFKSVNNSESSFLNLKPVTSMNQETPEIVNRNLPLQQSNSIPPRLVQIDLTALLFYFISI